MQYRGLGKTGIKVPAMAFGTMRFPLVGGSQFYTGMTNAQINEPESIKLIRYAIDQGMNYIDCGFNYDGGDCERIVGEALKDGYRDKTILVTKAPVWLYKTPEDFDKYLNQQLETLGTDHLDIYLMHGIGRASWEKKILRHNVLESLSKAKADGKIRFAGFSFHDDFSAFSDILNGYDWDVCQIQLNYYDEEFQAGIKGLKLAAEKGIGVTIMEPLRGGYLTRLPERAMDVIKTEGGGKTPAQLAFEYLWNMPEVSTVLSGMGSMAEIDENNRYADEAKALSAKDLEIYPKIVAALNSYDTVQCTGCSYCNVCPKHIAIPFAFRVYNYYKTGNEKEAIDFYRDQLNPFGAYPDQCIGCKACEDRCPQKINISEWMPKISDMFKGLLGDQQTNNAFKTK